MDRLVVFISKLSTFNFIEVYRELLILWLFFFQVLKNVKTFVDVQGFKLLFYVYTTVFYTFIKYISIKPQQQKKILCNCVI